MEVIYSSEKSVDYRRSTRRHIPKGNTQGIFVIFLCIIQGAGTAQSV
jgi:hypothetical protein